MTLQTCANVSPDIFVNLWNIFTDMSGPDFAGLLKEHKEKEAKAVLRAAGGDLGSVSSRDGKNIKHFKAFYAISKNIFLLI